MFHVPLEIASITSPSLPSEIANFAGHSWAPTISNHQISHMELYRQIHGKSMVYPLVMTNIAIEHGHGNSESSHE